MINELGYFRPLIPGVKPLLQRGRIFLAYLYKDNDPNILETSVVAHPHTHT